MCYVIGCNVPDVDWEAPGGKSGPHADLAVAQRLETCAPLSLPDSEHHSLAVRVRICGSCLVLCPVVHACEHPLVHFEHLQLARWQPFLAP